MLLFVISSYLFFLYCLVLIASYCFYSWLLIANYFCYC